MVKRHLRKLKTRTLPGVSLMARTAEMWAGAAQVIAARTMQIGSAGFPLSAKDQREIVLMGAEKVAALNEAALAAAAHMAQNVGKMVTPASTEVLAQKVLKPFRTRVKANVRRLSRKS